MTRYSTNEDGFEVIETFEGLAKKVLDAAGKWTGMVKSYKPIPGERWDEKRGKMVPNSNWTCGFGQEGAFFKGTSGEIPVNEHTVVTEQQAKDGLRWFVANVVDPMVWKHFNPRTQAEHNALASWCYNIHHDKLEKGEYSLPRLVNAGARDTDAVINKWLEYCLTPGAESGLYKRRLAETLMFMGLPWNTPAVWGFISKARVLRIDSGLVLPNASYVHPTGKFAATLDPEFIRGIAEQAKPIATQPDPPKAPKPVVPVETKPLPEIAKAPRAPVPSPAGTKPPSEKTVKPEDVPYRIDPNAGLKPLEESDRAKGFFWQQLAVMLLRLTGLGTFGTTAAGVANVVQSDAALSGAIFNLTIPLLVLGTGLATSFVVRSYGNWKRKRGEESATQGLY